MDKKRIEINARKMEKKEKIEIEHSFRQTQKQRDAEKEQNIYLIIPLYIDWLQEVSFLICSLIYHCD